MGSHGSPDKAGLPELTPPAAGGRSTTATASVAAALAALLAVAGLAIVGQRLGPEYALFALFALLLSAAALLLALRGASGHPAALLGLVLLAALRLELGGVYVYAFDPVLLVMLVVWAGKAVAGRAPAPRLSLPDILWLLLLGWLGFASLAAPDAALALNGWLLWARVFLIYFYCAQCLDARGIWLLVWVFLAVVMLQGGLGLLQFVTRSNVGSISDLVGGSVGVAREITLTEGETLYRVRGTLGYDTALAHWLELLLPLLVSMSLALRRGLTRLWLLVGVILGTAGLVVTFTRGAWFGLVAGVGVVIVLSLTRILRRPRLMAAIAAALVLMAVAALPFAGHIRDRLVSTEDDTLSVRANLNRAALEIIADYPVTGIGLENFPLVAPAYQAGYEWEAEGAEHKVHNLFLALAVEGGIPAALLYVLLQALVLWLAWRLLRRGGEQLRGLALGIGAGMVAVVVHGLAAWGLISYTVLPLWALLMGMIAAAARLAPGRMRT